jgi:hypothetical protein
MIYCVVRESPANATIFWGVDGDGAPDPTIFVNIGDNSDFNQSQVYSSLSQAVIRVRLDVWTGSNWWVKTVELHSDRDTIILTALGLFC